jgi:LysR family hydrogen peroxide-inducible transcriptional activator
MGVSIVPEMAIERSAPCHFIRIADDQAFRIIGTVYLRGRSRSRLYDSFLSLLRSSFASPTP